MWALVLGVCAWLALTGGAASQTAPDQSLAQFQGAWRSKEGDYALKIEGTRGTFCEATACITGVTTVLARVGSATVIQINDEPALHARGVWIFSAEPDRLQIQNTQKEVVTLLPVDPSQVGTAAAPPPSPRPTAPDRQLPTMANFEGLWQTADGSTYLVFSPDQASFCQKRTCLSGVPTIVRNVPGETTIHIYDSQSYRLRVVWVQTVEEGRLVIANADKQVTELKRVTAATFQELPLPDDQEIALGALLGTWNAENTNIVLRIQPGQALYCEGNSCIRGVPAVTEVAGSAVFLRISASGRAPRDMVIYLEGRQRASIADSRNLRWTFKRQ